MEEIVEYHELAKIGIKDIFYFYNIEEKGKTGWKYDEKSIETIDGRMWLYNKESNLYTLQSLKLQTA